MVKENVPFLTDEFLDKLVKEINQQYGWQTPEQNIETITND
jgi:alanine-alpha-ketoisovalerate/valine-pyruvate aminotransferase